MPNCTSENPKVSVRYSGITDVTISDARSVNMLVSPSRVTLGSMPRQPVSSSGSSPRSSGRLRTGVYTERSSSRFLKQR